MPSEADFRDKIEMRLVACGDFGRRRGVFPAHCDSPLTIQDHQKQRRVLAGIGRHPPVRSDFGYSRKPGRARLGYWRGNGFVEIANASSAS